MIKAEHNRWLMINLEPCPFCGKKLEVKASRFNPYARCITEDCIASKLPMISLDIREDVERWNKRAPTEVKS